MADAMPGAGDVPIILDEKDMLLRPTLQACIAISSIAGGLEAALQRCLNLDMDTICRVVSAGLNVNPVQAKGIPDAVYRTGMVNVLNPCIEFIKIVSNGGRPMADEDDGGEGDDVNPLTPA